MPYFSVSDKDFSESAKKKRGCDTRQAPIALKLTNAVKSVAENTIMDAAQELKDLIDKQVF